MATVYKSVLKTGNTYVQYNAQDQRGRRWQDGNGNGFYTYSQSVYKIDLLGNETEYDSNLNTTYSTLCIDKNSEYIFYIKTVPTLGSLYSYKIKISDMSLILEKNYGIDLGSTYKIYRAIINKNGNIVLCMQDRILLLDPDTLNIISSSSTGLTLGSICCIDINSNIFSTYPNTPTSNLFKKYIISGSSISDVLTSSFSYQILSDAKEDVLILDNYIYHLIGHYSNSGFNKIRKIPLDLSEISLTVDLYSETNNYGFNNLMHDGINMYCCSDTGIGYLYQIDTDTLIPSEIKTGISSALGTNNSDGGAFFLSPKGATGAL